MKSKRLIAIFLFLYHFSIAQKAAHQLYYLQPANHFEESLVIGNGRVGAAIHGGTKEDKIYLNDITLWSGEPVNPYMNKEAHTYLPLVREALRSENYRAADSLQHFLQGKFSESYAPLGTCYLKTNHEARNYKRTLDLQTAISTVSYEANGVIYTKEYFASNPANLLVIRFTSSKANKLSFSLTFDSKLKHKLTDNKANTLVYEGYAPLVAQPSYRGIKENAVVFEENRGTRFTSAFEVSIKSGKISQSDSTITVNNATEAIIYISLATSFNGFDKNPVTEGLNDKAIALQQLMNKKPIDELKATHIADYQQFYNRVKLQINEHAKDILPTDERLKNYKNGAVDNDLEVLYFNFGRYLLISSSRTKGVPANLQGLWNPHIQPPWSSNYTTNINAEMNYWLAENCNLSEMHQPLLSFIENTAKTGAITAKTFFNANGWCLAHNSDIWAMTNPVGDFGKGSPVWANWYMGGTWISTHLWEHYTFTQDKSFLASKAYPLMKGAAEFCLAMLVHDGRGYLVTSPSTSPENLYKMPNGYTGATLYGSTADLAMIRELFQQTIRATEILGYDAAFATTLKRTLNALYPYQISQKGYLQEWYFDWDDQDPKHRHQSHLFGLYPGHHILVNETPALAEACKQTLEVKGDETTGWSKGWRTNLWARLKDGNRTYKMYRELLRYVEPDGIRPKFSEGGGTYPNLFDAHPPFQIDGNFGGTAAVAEMLVQSTETQIELLPALPDAWKSGNVSGLKARGGFEVAIEWSNNRLTKATISTKTGGETLIQYKNENKKVTLLPNQTIEVTF